LELTTHTTRSEVDDRLLSPLDMARLCQISVKTVYRAIGDGELAATRVRSRLRVRDSDLHAWIEAGRVDQQPATRLETESRAGSLRALLVTEGQAGA
jgi:excisionase family DNA binding protein